MSHSPEDHTLRNPPPGADSTDEYVLQSPDGTSEAVVPQWLYDLVMAKDARVSELEAAVRTLHALAESHFGEGTIDVPAMPDLNRK